MDGFDVKCMPNPAGLPAIEWIYYLFRECAYTNLDVASISFGYLSILCWIFAQVPQLLENWRRGTADSLSLLFLSNWLLGDVCNLIGCILTHQLPFQTYLASYFVFIDSSLLCQALYYYYHKKLTRWRRKQRRLQRQRRREQQDNTDAETTPLLEGEDESPASSPTLAEQRPLPRSPLQSFLLFWFGGWTWFSSDLSGVNAIPLRNETAEQAAPRCPNHIPFSFAYILSKSAANLYVSPMSSILDIEAEIIGQIAAWICTCLYLSSRLPQIYHNFCRKSVKGLAVGMFLCACMGNLTYSISIILRSFSEAEAVRQSQPLAVNCALPSPEEAQMKVLIDSLPYLLGSGGTVIFDVIIFIQFLWYSLVHQGSEDGDTSESEGRFPRVESDASFMTIEEEN